MRKRTRTSMAAALGLLALVGLVAALAPSISWPNVARAHETGFAYLSALTVTAEGTALTLSPAFSNTVEHYTVLAADTVNQITIEATLDGDGTPDHNATLVYQDRFGTELSDANTTTDGLQVNIPTGDGGTRINVAVRHVEPRPRGSGTFVRKKTYSVRVIRTGTEATERAALMALYNSTGGANWTTKTNWGSTESISTWYGVSTRASGTRLLLFGNNLVGTIPDELDNFTDLGSLNLGKNQLTGTVPASLGNLANLTDLRLINNQLTGNLAWLSSLTNLQHLYLSGSALSGSANTPGNEFTGNLAWLSSLTQLVYLELAGSQLSGAIPNLSSHTALQYLYLNDNQLSGSIPSSLSSLTRLFYLFLNSNQLSGSIPDLSSHTSLFVLYLWGNQLTGEIPASLGSMTSLTQLSLSRNQLTGEIPASLGNLTNLQYLYLNANQLSGSIPSTLGSLTNLNYLILHDNQLSGSIPDELGSLRKLWYLYLHDNLLTGTIPDELGNLTNLYILNLNQNQLSGSIPSLGSSFGNLQELSLSSNKLTGSIPSSLGSLPNLQRLYLGDNELSGTIPSSLGNRTTLQELSLWGNDLTGSIPNLGSLTNLLNLHLHGNQLSGSIPSTLGSLSSLLQLKLQENQLTGSIPSTLGNLTSLLELSLSGNKLTGSIPDSLGTSNNDLQNLYLNNNQLSGTIPASLGSLPDLRITRLAGNKDADDNPSLIGCVPEELRFLVTADEFAPGVPAHDFIAVDANNDGDTDDEGDIPGLNLPFCTISALALSDVTLAQAFAVDTAAYTASVANTVAATTVTATLNDSRDTVSIMKGTTTYANGASVPLDVGSNEITIEVTPADGTRKQTYTVTVFREGEDQAALIALYDSVGGASWTNRTNWKEPGVAIGMWQGVTTNGSGSVTALDLSGNNLRGTLPADLGSLTSLTTLNLRDNRLSGTIPDLRALTRLTTLNLSDNSLNGTLPDLSALTNLENLYLGDNRFSGEIPDWLDSLTQLQELSLRGNRLTGTIPEELGELYQLYLLYLDDNQLSGPIPAALGKLSGLQATRFAGNALTGCVPNGLRYLVTALEFESLPAHDFIAVDANSDGDTDDVGDTPGLELPFCTLRALSFSGGVTLDPAFASDTATYTASADHYVTSTTVTATLHSNSDTVSITKGADTYTTSVPLDVGPNAITIEVTPADNTPTHTYTVTVTRAPNAPPAFDESPTTTRGVDENTTAGENIGDPLEATDADNDTLIYSLDAAGAESFDIDGSSGQLQTKAALDFEDKSSYTVTVSVRDSRDADGNADNPTDDTITVTILVADVNEVPEFPFSETGMRTIPENTAVGVNIGAPVAATDGDNDTLTYSLDTAGAESFDIVSTSGQLQTKAALDFEPTSTRSYTVTVTATDPSGEADTITVTIAVTNEEEPGTVTLSLLQPQVGTPLTATVSDPDIILTNIEWRWDGSQNGISWTPISSTINATTTSSYTPSTTVVGRFLRAGASYTDGEDEGKSARAVSVNRVQAAPVEPNNPPQFPPPAIESLHRYVNENTPAGEDIGAPVAATDADNDTLTYTLGGTDAASFDIDPSSGQLLTKAPLDRETKNSYSVTVTADDSSDRSTITISITIFDVDEPGTVTLSSVQPQVGTALTATLDDPTYKSDLTWSWERSSDQVFWIVIIGADTDTYTPVVGDVGNYLRATASYIEFHGSLQEPQAVSDNTVEVPPGRNAPVFTEGASTTRSVAETTTAGVNIGAPVEATDGDNDILTYILGGPDEEFFDIVTSSGQLKTEAPLNRASRNSYTVTVSVHDGKDDQGMPEADPQIDTTTEVTISVRSGGGGGGGGGGGAAPANREPTFIEGGKTTRSAPEDTAEGVGFGEPVAATDRDDDTLTYTLRGDDADSFDIDGRTAQLLAKVPLDYESRARYSLEVRVSDGEGGSDTIDLTVRVTNVNEPPVITGPATEDYEENGADAVAAYTAEDPEGTEIAWSLAGGDAGAFAISDAGLLTFIAPPDNESPEDADGDNVYQVTVQATDATETVGALEVTVTVTDVDDGGMYSRYDLNKNGLIERDEALRAVFDYFADLITKDEAIEVVLLYFAS